ncbi:hypothetical protein EV356DRAFT_500824 [Viridothelium virens]|uniref:Uncharacterized protein n=1 Tax=Viridothelium virens TaxID=1048519 RepID=A0A6A6HCH8_VIRVR|nr:hypothetical protein EV356DRAFT_500824 [Viridothelium virens]
MESLLQAQQRGVVVGLKGVANGSPVSRLDIDELLVKKPDAFNLFLLALDDLQNEKNTKEKMGYYQVAGIAHPLSA